MIESIVGNAACIVTAWLAYRFGMRWLDVRNTESAGNAKAVATLRDEFTEHRVVHDKAIEKIQITTRDAVRLLDARLGVFETEKAQRKIGVQHMGGR